MSGLCINTSMIFTSKSPNAELSVQPKVEVTKLFSTKNFSKYRRIAKINYNTNLAL